jgi:hypothetical protein
MFTGIYYASKSKRKITLSGKKIFSTKKFEDKNQWQQGFTPGSCIIPVN